MPNWEDFIDPMHPDAGGPGMAFASDEYSVDIQPGPLKLECAACGRSAYLDNLKLCDQCRDEYDQEARELDAREREFEDREARGIFYGR